MGRSVQVHSRKHTQWVTNWHLTDTHVKINSFKLSEIKHNIKIYRSYSSSLIFNVWSVFVSSEMFLLDFFCFINAIIIIRTTTTTVNNNNNTQFYLKKKWGPCHFYSGIANSPCGVLNTSHIHTCARLRNHGRHADEDSPEENPKKKRKEQKASTHSEADRRCRQWYVFKMLL